jgi:MFS family permease
MDQTYKSFPFLSFLIFIITLGGFLYGYTLGELNLLLVNLGYLYNWGSDSSLYEGLCQGLFGLGGLLGVVIVLCFLLNKGRRGTLMIADVIGIIGACICVIYEKGGSGVPQFIGRLIGGIAVGINSQMVPIYINEISPIEISGIMGSMFQTMVNLGILTSNLTCLTIQGKVDDAKDYDLDSNWWRFVFLFPVLTCSLRLIMLGFVFKFDTPFSLMSRNDKIAATETVQMIYKNEYVDEILKNLESKMSSAKDISYKQLFSSYKNRILLFFFFFYDIVLCFC